MIRRGAAIVLALTLAPALVSAQDTVFTVTAQSADVYKGPTTVTPIIGRAPRGSVLAVSRNLGSWAKVTWPTAPDGVGYVHLTTGRLSSGNAAAPAPNATVRPPAGPGAAATPPPLAARLEYRDQPAVSDQPVGAPISHILGVGGRFGSARSVGATARVWRDNRLAIQVSLMRGSMTSDAAAGRVTSLQVEPGAMYALFDHMGNHVWITPYIGSGLSFHHQTLKVSSPDGTQASDNGFGFRVFGGSELTFTSVPRLGLSVEFGYRRAPTPFPGFETDKLSASVAGHWYVR